jgi:hypothetical protein
MIDCRLDKPYFLQIFMLLVDSLQDVYKSSIVISAVGPNIILPVCGFKGIKKAGVNTPAL